MTAKISITVPGYAIRIGSSEFKDPECFMIRMKR